MNFATDMFDIDGTARGILDSQADWLQRYPNARITLEGHCDERGTREYNLALGDRRANSAKNYLVARGVAASRITTISYGKERPLALGSDEASYAQNRRAVTVVLSGGGSMGGELMFAGVYAIPCKGRWRAPRDRRGVTGGGGDVPSQSGHPSVSLRLPPPLAGEA